MADAVHDLTHDHAALNRQVVTLARDLRNLTPEDRCRPLEGKLRELRDTLFLHFAREEEGLFPFIATTEPQLRSDVDAMLIAHDTICGALARMVHLAATDAPAAGLLALFDRFERAYAEHSDLERAVLAALDTRLDGAARARLSALLDGL